MAYPAVVSLVQTLNQQLLQYSDRHEFQLPLQYYYPKTQIESLQDKLCSLQSSIDKIFPVQKRFRNEVNELENQIRDTVYKAQDTIESFICTIESVISESSRVSSVLQEIVANIDPISATAGKIAASIGRSKEDTQRGDSLPYKAPSAKSTSIGKNKIVGLEEDLARVTDQLTSASNKLHVVPIYGMAGIGKTTLAKSIYEDSRIEDYFHTRAWVTVSPEYHVRDIFLKLLGSMASKGQKSDVSGSTNKLDDELSQKSDAQLAVDLHQRLFDKRYLIVVDDMWDSSVWDKVRQYLPDDEKGSRILLTTRISDVADYAKSSDFRHEMRLLDSKDSWKLLSQRVFGDGEGLCPPHLEKIGMDIANNCRGLPLSITVVGGLLFKERKKGEDYWKIIAESTTAAAAATESEDDQSYKEILSLSYNHLPGKLKGCFLYMGAFPQDSEIFVSKLIQLWVAEGFITTTSQSESLQSESLEVVAEHYLKDLVDRNLILARKSSSDGRIKTCGMHDTIRDLAVEESGKEKFFHAICMHDQENSEGKYNQRRLSVHRNILMCMADVYNTTKSVKLTRTLLYAGPHHHHPFPFRLTFKLLRVLDALTIYFIAFPTEIVKLIHLRYLSCTFNGKLPPSISKLRNLEVLIVRRYPRLVFSRKSILPAEIWNMPQLRHIVFTESSLPDPILAQNPVVLANLQSLSKVNAAACTKEVFQKIPNLKKLEIWIAAPGAVNFYLDELQQLEGFKFTVLNPVPDSKIDFLPKLIFPKTLRKLSLSGCGIPWKDMEVIAELPNLEVLKLRQSAFQGHEWEPKQETRFYQLKFLLLESLDLQDWNSDDSHFPSLERLIIRHCYELVYMPSDIELVGGLQLIEVVDCSTSAVDWAEFIKKKQLDAGNKCLQVRIYSSWE